MKKVKKQEKVVDLWLLFCHSVELDAETEERRSQNRPENSGDILISVKCQPRRFKVSIISTLV
jgi:hypothetical protein